MEGNLIEVAFVPDETKIKGLISPVIPPHTRYAPRQVIPAYEKDPENRRQPRLDGKGQPIPIPFKRFFHYKSRLYTLEKINPAASAAWYFRGRVNGTAMNRNTQRAGVNEAVSEVIRRWLDAPQTDAAKDRNRNLDKIPLPRFFEAWVQICGEERKVVCRDLLSGARRILRVLYPSKPESQLNFDDLFNDSTSRNYKKKRIGIAEREAAAKHGKDAKQEIKIAKAKATSASANTLKRIKGFFADKDGSLIKEYEKLGLKLPVEAIREYRETKIKGARAAHAVYVRPDDALIKRTFTEIKKFDCDEPLTVEGTEYTRDGEVKERVRKKAWSRRKNSKAGIAEARKYHIYILFWMCVGFGLRVKEAASTPKKQIRFVDGLMTVMGIGKTESKMIDIPAQPAAAKALEKWLRHDKCEYLMGPNWNYRYYVIPKVLRGLMREWGWETGNLLHELRAYIGYKIYEVDPVAAMHYMRHESLETTEKFYAGKFMTRRAAVINLEF